jgi:hypothetical protein
MSQVQELTAQQEALIDEYKRKWQLIVLSTNPIDRNKATQAIKAIYKQVKSLEYFDMYFFDSPLGVANLSFLEKIYPTENWGNSRKHNNLIRRVEDRLIRRSIPNDFFRDVILKLIEIIAKQIDIQLWHHVDKKLRFYSPLWSILGYLYDAEKSSLIWKSAKPNNQMKLEHLWRFLANGLETPDRKASVCCLFDFCISELQCVPDENLWNILKEFVTECGWTFFFQDFCFVCDRPIKILLNEQNQPHSEIESAIQFSDGFSIFAKNGQSIENSHYFTFD